MTEKQIQNFLGKIEKTSGCWNWTGSKDSGGYGRFNFNYKNIKATRFSYIFFIGEIPKGIGFHGTCVLHKCDNRICVNPEHLFLGTQKDNIQDMIKKKRGLIGEKNAKRKLKFSDVTTIRQAYRRGIFTQRFLAKLFKVDRRTVCAVINFKTYKN